MVNCKRFKKVLLLNTKFAESQSLISYFLHVIFFFWYYNYINDVLGQYMMFWKRNHNYSKIVYWKRNLFSFLFCVVLYLILIQYLFLIKLYILSPFSWKYNFQQCGYRQRLRTTTKVNTSLLVIFPCCIRRDLTEWQLLYLGKAKQQLFSSGSPQFRSIQVLD